MGAGESNSRGRGQLCEGLSPHSGQGAVEILQLIAKYATEIGRSFGLTYMGHQAHMLIFLPLPISFIGRQRSR